MTMTNEIKAHLVAGLETLLDPYMADHEFGRAKDSLIYKRELNGSTQKIDIAVEIHPKDRPDSAAAYRFKRQRGEPICYENRVGKHTHDIFDYGSTRTTRVLGCPLQQQTWSKARPRRAQRHYRNYGDKNYGDTYGVHRNSSVSKCMGRLQ
jgi:hypothetical protein